jgi:protein kinase-like protein
VPQSPSQATLAQGTVLTKRYRIEKLIGSGGYASVYKATDLTFGYERAIKEVSDTDQGVRNQFRLEAELLINSRHPNIPHGYHLIEDMGRLFLVMDFVSGKDLEELLNESLTQKQRPLDEATVLRWAVEICDALHQMHTLRVPVIHRDIKPANIKITPEGRPVLIDFGLAKLQQRAGPTMTAAQGVSPGFAPPEQYMAKGRTDARSDIYGLGATLYACLTGKDPPEAPGRLLAQTGAGGHGMQLNAVRRLNPRVSEETDRIVIKALELSPANRQQSAAQLRDELSASLSRLTGGMQGSTMVMGPACARCGTANRPDAIRCVNCNAPLRHSDPPRQPALANQNPDAGAKRTLISAQGAGRGTGKQPVVAPNRGSPLAAAGNDPRTGRQAAVAAADQRSGKQVAVAANGGTGKRRALTPAGEGKGGTSVMGAVSAASLGGAIVPLPSRVPQAAAAAKAATALAERETAEVAAPKGWIRTGKTPLSAFGKVMLVLASVEVLWGAFVLVLGGVAIAANSAALPIPQLVIGWLVIVVLGSLIGGQAITRPVYRSGRVSPARRWLQGFGVVVYTLAVHAVAVWGATIFATQQSNPGLATLSFMLFGVNILVVGIFAVINTLS